jgi:hypothetical protein
MGFSIFNLAPSLSFYNYGIKAPSLLAAAKTKGAENRFTF